MATVAAGIHFGNTNCSVAVCKDGRVEVISNDAGDRLTPTVVAYTGNEKVIGLPAKLYWRRNPTFVLKKIKSTIGKSFSKDEGCKASKSCLALTQDDSGNMYYNIDIDDKTIKVTPEEAAMYVMTKLLVDAESVGGTELEDAVLAVPCYFTEKQKIALSETAEEAGFNILRVISEPAAALLAHDIGQSRSSQPFNVLTFKLGGTSCEAAIVEVNSGTYRILESGANLNIGGELLDKALLNYCIQEFKRQWKLDISENLRAQRTLTQLSEQCKHTLSMSSNTTCAAESLHEGIDFQLNITRAKLESLSSKIFADCFELVKTVLEKSKCSKESIAKVVLFGGSVRIPKIQQMFRDFFVNSEVHLSANPDEVIATGAAIEAGILQGKDDTNTEASHYLDCLPRHICIKRHVDGLRELVPLIEKMTPVPVKRIKVFETESIATSLCVKIFETDNLKDFANAVCIGKIIINDLPSAQLRLMFTAEYKRDGTLRIVAEEQISGKAEAFVLEPAA